MIAVIRGIGNRQERKRTIQKLPQFVPSQSRRVPKSGYMPKRVSSPLSGGGNLRFRAPTKVSLKKSFLLLGKRPFWICGKRGKYRESVYVFFPVQQRQSQRCVCVRGGRRVGGLPSEFDFSPQKKGTSPPFPFRRRHIPLLWLSCIGSSEFRPNSIRIILLPFFSKKNYDF